MKRLQLVYIFLFFVSLAVIGQVNQVWWSKGRVLHVNPVAGIDSVTFGQFVNADTFLIVIDRASRLIVYDTIDEHVPGMVFHDTIYTTHTVYLEPGRRIGVFSVAKDRQVSFSQGNLQYVRNQDVWKFADQQYEYIGARNVKDGQLANKIDLFGWSADNTTASFGVSTSTKAADYAGEFVDWGVNEISEDASNTWRTLAVDEWEYLIAERENASSLYGVAEVADVNGLIILPDNWVLPEGLTFQSGFAKKDGDLFFKQHQIFTKQQWQLLEKAGAIFLPTAGIIKPPTTIVGSSEGAHYQSSDRFGNYSNYWFGFRSSYYTIQSQERCVLRSVRLVHDTIVPPPAPCETFEVNGVKFNMMCVEGGTFTMGAGSDVHQVTLSDYYIGETEVTQSLWLAVMGGELPPRQEIMGDEYPVADITMVDCRRFVERLTELTGRHFRIPTEAEWEYAARGGKKSKGYKYAGSDNIDEVAWYNGNATEYRPQIVKQYKPNELGVYDMSGNVCEWVSDWYAPYNLYPQINPTGASIYSDSKLPHIHRGGCWTYAPAQCQPERRTGWSHKSANGIGLRIVMSDEEPFREVYVNDTTRFYLRKVEKGTFMMGAKEDDLIVMQNLDAKGDELPQHEVTLDSDYYVAEYEITQSLWEAVMGTDVYDMYAALTRPSVYPNPVGVAYPMYYVYTKDILEFARKLSQMTGLKFRLPTEAEWEFAAKGGNRSHGYLYAGSNNVDSVAWYGNKGMQQVGQLMPNELGIYDMSGNGLERCVDYLEYHQPYESGDVVNPRGKIRQNGNRAYRGGSHNMHKDSVRVTHRAPQTPTFTSINVGARLVMNEEHHFQTFNVGSVWFDMIYVKGGTFMMGCTQEMDSNAYAHESPMHEVTLSDYYIGQIEVTQALWKNVMGNSNNPSTHKGNDLPVHNVSWDDCQLFIEKLNLMTGLNFRMPTEAEWEYAARGGVKSRGYKYAGSDNIDEVAWYKENADGKPHTFATKQPNELGIYDMSGNVFEWCYDWYGLYSVEAQVDPQGPESGPYRVFRGGGWKHVSSSRVAYRRTTGANLDQTSIGIRLVLDERPMPPTMPEYVDLGLSVKWATFNLGASAPEEYGDYFAWGETEPKEEYSWATYKWCDGTDSVMTKYNAIDGLISLQSEDDAAHVNWGGDWRMPTKEELDELCDKCNWEWIMLNGVNGCKVTGPNGNSIFLPAAGSYNTFDNQLNSEGINGWLLSSDRVNKRYVMEIGFLYSGPYKSTCSRCVGLTIRPVLPN